MIAGVVRNQLRVLLGVVALVTLSLVGAPAASATTQQCELTSGSYAGVKIEDGMSPATVQVLDTTTQKYVSVIVTITGTSFTVTAADPSVTLTDASWCIKSSTETNTGTGTTGLSGSFNNNGVRQAISYVMLYTVTTGAPPPPTCTQFSQSGFEGVSSWNFDLGKTGPTTFGLYWGPFDVADQVQVNYEGKVIFDSGVVTGEHLYSVNVPAGTSTEVTIVVNGGANEVGKNWSWTFTAKCPS